jgi:hypothetical protein
MNRVKINVEGKERTILTTGIPDMSNPLTAKLLETICKAGDKAREPCNQLMDTKLEG